MFRSCNACNKIVGIGGKSWASLNRTVTFTLVKGGKKWKYLCWKGESLIDFDLIQEDVTDEKDGVLFEMPIRDYSEYNTFKSKAKQKLAYFDTVVLIIDGNIWDNKIYRNDLFQYSLYPPYTQMHLCLKDVVYPIQFDKIDMTPIHMNIAIRLGLDEGIQVNPSRESIIYTRETIALIKKRIYEVADFFAEKYNESIKEPVSFYENYEDIGTPFKWVDLKDKKFEVNALSTLANFNSLQCIGMKEKPSTWYKSNIALVLSNLGIKAWYNWKGTWKTSKIYEYIPRYYADKNKVHLVDGELRGYFKEYLKDTFGTYELYVEQTYPKPLSWYKRNVLGNAPKSKWRTIIQEFQAVQEQAIKDFCIDNRGLQISKEFLDYSEKKKQYLRDNRGVAIAGYKVLNKQDGEVTIAYSRPSLIGNTLVFEKNVFKLSDLRKSKKLTIVFDEEDKELAKEVAQMVVKQKVAIVGQREFKKIQTHQFKYWKDMIAEGNKPFRRIVTAILADKLIEKYTSILGRKSDIVNNCLQHIVDDVRFLTKYRDNNYTRISSEVTTSILDVATTHNLWDGEVKPVIERLEKAIETFNFVQYMELPNSWESDRKDEVIKVINQMLLFRKKYYNDLKDYVLTYVAPPAEILEPADTSVDETLISIAIDNLDDSTLEEDQLEGIEIEPEGGLDDDDTTLPEWTTSLDTQILEAVN